MAFALWKTREDKFLVQGGSRGPSNLAAVMRTMGHEDVRAAIEYHLLPILGC
jgi:hypothetical protein